MNGAMSERKPLEAQLCDYVAKLGNADVLAGRKINVVHLGRLGAFQESNILVADLKRLILMPKVSSILFIGDSPPLEHPKIIHVGRVDPECVGELISHCQLGLSYKKANESGQVNIPIRVHEYLNEGLVVRSNRSKILEGLFADCGCRDRLSIYESDDLSSAVELSGGNAGKVIFV